jgi:hypothetical protein
VPFSRRFSRCAALAAQQDLAGEATKKPKPKPDCLDGTRYDDGKLENGLRPVAFEDNYVMLLETPSYPAKLEKVCIAWRRTSFWNDIWFDVRIWAADGPNGSPGMLVDTIPTLHAANIPTKGKFYNYDVNGYGIVIEPAGPLLGLPRHGYELEDAAAPRVQQCWSARQPTARPGAGRLDRCSAQLQGLRHPGEVRTSLSSNGPE